jgi:tRNA-dihydrouridine synthase
MQKKLEVLVAPLEGHSDKAFRKLCYKYGADKTVMLQYL